MNTKNFKDISELKEYMNKTMKLSSENIFNKYLSKIFTNLMEREAHSDNVKSKHFSREQNSSLYLQKEVTLNNYVKDKMNQNDFNLSLNNFLDFLDIQEFIGKLIYLYIKQSTKNDKLSKIDFCEGLNRLYYGNINELIDFTFFLADFNNDGKIYQTDMKIVMAYIPCFTEFSQKNYVKQINKIINTFFEDKLSNNEILYEGNEQELNLEIFKKYILKYKTDYNEENYKEEKRDGLDHEFLNNYDYNAPFFYFISIMSYLYKNLPFNKSNVELFSITKNNKKVKMRLDKNNATTVRSKNVMFTESKGLGLLKSLANTKTNSFFKNNITTNSKRYSVNYSNRLSKEVLPKIRKTNLFAIQKSGSQIFLKKEKVHNSISKINNNKNKIQNTSRSINKHDYIIAKKRDLSDQNLPYMSISQQKQQIFENSISLFRKSNKIAKNKLSPFNHETGSNSTTKNTSSLFLNKSNSNELKEKYINLRSKLPSIPIDQKKYSPVIGIECSHKLKEEIKNEIKEPEEFSLCEYSDNDDDNNRNSLFGRDSNKSENIFQLNESYLFKYDDNDFHPNILKKCYAVIKEKEIIFFSTEQKTEFSELWYIHKGYISTGKETILKTKYYTINITFENNFIKKLYFLNENICQSFSLSIKNSIKDYNFYDYYNLLNTLGEGHFGKVYRCESKKSEEIYAVKIINKAKLKPKDVDLIRQEKNYLNLIKHENIISLKDFFEDKQNIYFITEYYEGGDLLSYLDDKQKMGESISEKNCARIIRKIAQCISYLNFFGIIHRDLKPENIMFAKPNNFKTLKLIDLGVCKTLSYGEKAKDPIGTNGYISPEIYLHKDYSFKIDVWSLGIILYLLITGGILPFDDQNLDTKLLAKTVVYLQQEYPIEYFGNKSKRLVNILDKMLEKSENKRININNLLKDCWFDIIKK